MKNKAIFCLRRSIYGGSVDGRVVDVAEATATTIPGRYADAPMVKYAVSGGAKTLYLIGTVDTAPHRPV